LGGEGSISCEWDYSSEICINKKKKEENIDNKFILIISLVILGFVIVLGISILIIVIIILRKRRKRLSVEITEIEMEKQ
jgi:hypothetical protein